MEKSLKRNYLRQKRFIWQMTTACQRVNGSRRGLDPTPRRDLCNLNDRPGPLVIGNMAPTAQARGLLHSVGDSRFRRPGLLPQLGFYHRL
jgi:hypothetical protein